MNTKTRFSLFVVVVVLVLSALLGGCESEANVASYNVSQAADNFEIARRITFYNGITGEGFLVIEGLCSLGNYDADGELSVTCKTGPAAYQKHFLGLSDNVTYFAEQIESASVNSWNYRVIMRPSALWPDIDIELP